MLGDRAAGYDRFALVGHSMGGLVIQAFVLEELIQKRREYLDRLTEVILYGTPSGGLKKAGWGANVFVTQIEDMNVSGEFIVDLRQQWKIWVDDSRSKPDRLSRFKLTLVAGMKDQFVPMVSSLDPFPMDEKEIVPGNHIEMVKPDSANSLCYTLLRKRLLRGTPTFRERQDVAGESPEVISRVNRVLAAAELDDVDDLLDQAKEALAETGATLPLVDRALGMALLDNQWYAEAAKLLARYLDFRDADGAQPFRHDARLSSKLPLRCPDPATSPQPFSGSRSSIPRCSATPRARAFWLAASSGGGWRSPMPSNSVGERSRSTRPRSRRRGRTRTTTRLCTTARTPLT